MSLPDPNSSDNQGIVELSWNIPELSVVIIARDEERNISDCLRSVLWAGEIIVIDNGSTDNTVEIARSLGAIVHQEKWRGYGPTKSRAVELATGEWILSLDADERITPTLAEEIREVLTKKQADGYEIPRLTNFIGSWIKHSGWYPDYVLRLFRKGQGEFTQSLVHERVILKGTALKLRQPILHYSYRSLEEYLQRLNKYTTLAAEELNELGVGSSLWRRLLSPLAMFIKRYFIKRGFLDGWPGLQIAVLSAMYVFVKYAKLDRLARLSRQESSSHPTGDSSF